MTSQQNPDGEPDDEKDRAASPERTSAGNPATNILLIDVLLRAGLRLGRRYLEKGLLSRHIPPEQAHRLIQGRPVSKSFFSILASRIASRSVPGGVLVGGGILAKMLIDRRRSSRQATAKTKAETASKAGDA